MRESLLVDTFLCLIWGNKGAHSDGVSLQLGGYAAFKVTWAIRSPPPKGRSQKGPVGIIDFPAPSLVDGIFISAGGGLSGPETHHPVPS